MATGRLDAPQAGLADAVLDATDVLIWWGRLRHDDVPDDRAAAVADRVRAGRLGLVALHASFASKPFRRLMDATCLPQGWRDDGRPEHVAIKAPEHPLARGVAPFTIPRSSMFVEPFAVPTPESVVFVSSWDSGETFRSGLTWTVDRGRVAYFRPGHDAFPVLFHPAASARSSPTPSPGPPRGPDPAGGGPADDFPSRSARVIETGPPVLVHPAQSDSTRLSPDLLPSGESEHAGSRSAGFRGRDAREWPLPSLRQSSNCIQALGVSAARYAGAPG